tara:strand:+ start:150 stop:1001 length:852 start_codon:yes stop_codon:yes gene_type:complete
MKTFKEHVACCDECYDHIVEASEYQGKKVTLNDPKRSSDGKKKFYVYVKNEKGNVIKLGFGDPNMEIKRDDPARRKSFRARHNCDDPGPKWKARYWSCYQWRAGAKVDEAQGPCWDGYEQRGMKKKGNKMVPNCVPVGEGVKQDKEIKDREGTQPAKYYAKDAEGDEMSKSTKQARARHFEKKKSGPAPGDKGAKTKPSKHTLKYKQMFGEAIEGLKKKAEKSGISYSILKKVYDRGMAAYKTGHRPGTTAQQWAFARVNSFITKGKGTWGGADKDLAAKVRK